MVLWCQHAPDQPVVAVLDEPDERAAWQGYAMVSAWQADSYVRALDVPRGAIRVLRNAIAPVFETTSAVVPWFVRGGPPVLAYTSTPFRGLDVLLSAFPAIRARFPGARLRVYSGMSVYNRPAATDPYAPLYDRVRALAGAEYIGPLPQADLARALAAVDVLAYPCTFAETSCISAMEAMAAGAFVVTTRLGALPETTAGFAPLLDMPADDGALAGDYARFAVEAMAGAVAAPAATMDRLAAQRRHAREEYCWSRRAQEWVDYLSRFVA
jgi:glycosyltransferase involved in cell wall biosynthesis